MREAILAANATNGPHTITFNIASGGLTNTPASALPDITEPFTIDGSTQPGYAGSPIIELNGQSAGSGVNGLRILAGASTVRGLVIYGFNGDGIEISGGGTNAIEGNIIGLDTFGNRRANGQAGVLITKSSATSSARTRLAR